MLFIWPTLCDSFYHIKNTHKEVKLNEMLLCVCAISVVGNMLQFSCSIIYFFGGTDEKKIVRFPMRRKRSFSLCFEWWKCVCVREWVSEVHRPHRQRYSKHYITFSFYAYYENNFSQNTGGQWSVRVCEWREVGNYFPLNSRTNTHTKKVGLSLSLLHTHTLAEWNGKKISSNFSPLFLWLTHKKWIEK
jgi:hypothetical protein